MCNPIRTLRCPDHAEELTPAEARVLALDLVLLADSTEGRSEPSGFVTRWEVLAELAALRRTVTELVIAREPGPF